MGVSRKTFTAATHQLEPDLTLPDLELPGRKSEPPRGAGRVRADAGRLRPRDDDRAAGRAGQEARRRASRDARAPSSRSIGVPPNVLLAIWGRETAFGGYKLPHNAIRVLATQGYYGRRKDMFREEFLLRAQDAGGGPRQARRHAQLLGRRHGAHAVPAVGVLQARRRFRRRRQEATSGTRCRMRSPRRRSSSSTRAGSAARAGPTRCARRAMSIARSACRRSRSRSASGCSAATCRRMDRRPSADRDERAGVTAAAGRHLRPGVPDAEELLRDQGIQFLRPLCAVRRPSEPIASAIRARSRRRGARTRSSRTTRGRDDAAAR